MKKQDFLDMLLGMDKPIDAYKINNELSLVFFIEDIERIIRTSREYNGFTFYNKAANKQSTCKAIGFDSYETDFTLEIHHVIYLYDIVYITGISMLKDLADDQFLMSYDVASQVMKDHFEGIIPIVPLSKTYHQLYHSGDYNFDKEDIYGDYEIWLDKYKEFITDFKMKTFKENLIIK